MRQNIFDENPVTRSRSVNLQNHSTVLVSSQSVRRRGARPARMGSEDKQAKKEKREARSPEDAAAREAKKAAKKVVDRRGRRRWRRRPWPRRARA